MSQQLDEIIKLLNIGMNDQIYIIKKIFDVYLYKIY